jgi:hypothetical protein
MINGVYIVYLGELSGMTCEDYHPACAFKNASNADVKAWADKNAPFFHKTALIYRVENGAKTFIWG